MCSCATQDLRHIYTYCARRRIDNLPTDAGSIPAISTCEVSGHRSLDVPRLFVFWGDDVSDHRSLFVGGCVRWFSLHSKFIFLEDCRVTSRFWAENVNKTNKSGVYSTLLFEGCRVNGFRVATVGRFDWRHLRFGLRGVSDDATHDQNDVVTHLRARLWL